MMHEFTLTIRTESADALMELQGKIAYQMCKVGSDFNAKFDVAELRIVADEK